MGKTKDAQRVTKGGSTRREASGKGAPEGAKKAATKPKRPVGRPTDYSDEIVEKLCLLLSEGKSLKSICDNDETMPDKSTIFRWLYKYPEFRDKYAYAKEIGCYAVEEEAIEIADDGRNDWMGRLDKDEVPIGWQLNGEHVQRSRLRVDTRKWFMERIAAKRYGTKVDVNHGVQPENPLLSLLQQVAGTALPVKRENEGE